MIVLPETYRQTRPTSCGPSCLLMAINYLQEGLIALNEREEIKIHDEIGHRDLFMYTMPSSMCRYLLDQGFEVNYFYYNNVDEHDDLIDICFAEDERIRTAIEDHPRFHYYSGFFKIDTVKRELEQDRPGFAPIRYTNASGEVQLHWLLLTNTLSKPDVSKYVFADPHDGMIKNSLPDELDRMMYLTGKVFISTWRPV